MKRFRYSHALLLLLVAFFFFLFGWAVGKRTPSDQLSVITQRQVEPAQLSQGGDTESPEVTSSDPAHAEGEKVNINTATLAQLMSLPYIGEVIAQRILDYRSAHGGFSSIDELMQVRGIGEKTLNKLRDFITLEDLP